MVKRLPSQTSSQHNWNRIFFDTMNRKIVAHLLLACALQIIFTANGKELCKVGTDCKAGCKCVSDYGPPVCVNQAAVATALTKCEKCDGSKNDKCDPFGCDTKAKVCRTCLTYATNLGAAGCGSNHVRFCQGTGDCGTLKCTCAKTKGTSIGTCAQPTLYRKDTAKCTTCSTDANCSTGKCQSVPDSIINRKICIDCAAKPQETAFSGCFAKSSATSAAPFKSGAKKTSTPPPCVSTVWLRNNGLANFAIRHAGLARVLCIPHLPCGTPGHLLRDGNSNLVSYREVCKYRRSDCVESVMSVSQLSHTFDWSQFRTIDDSLSLTSLSAHPHSTRWSYSRIIAHLNDRMNKLGLGSVCNVVALFPHTLFESNVFRYTPSSN